MQNIESDSDESHDRNSPTNTQFSDLLTNNESVSVFSLSNKNREISNKVKEIEKILFERLSNNWVSVRKAFLDLD